MNIKFTEIKQDSSPRLMDRISDENALHVLLHCLNLPWHYIVFDGEKFYIVRPTNNGWKTRTEFKGHKDTLLVLPTHHACTFALSLPFKLRRIAQSEWWVTWAEYNTLTANR